MANALVQTTNIVSFDGTCLRLYINLDQEKQEHYNKVHRYWWPPPIAYWATETPPWEDKMLPSTKKFKYMTKVVEIVRGRVVDKMSMRKNILFLIFKFRIISLC